MYFEQNVC
jgi:adenylate kinase family enzyme